MTSKLSGLCAFADGRVTVAGLDLDNYISTENMLPNKEGITRSAGLPTVNQTQAYQAKDVLVSNIRPYFRKIWYADRDGGCSNDVLVFRANENVYPNFLYYLLSDDTFFDYATATAKGTKMPRGDKGAIMRYEVPDLPLDIQIEIADTLSALDARIAENRAINNHLASTSQTDSSPDMRRGNRVSRSSARRVISCSSSDCRSKRHSTVSRNLSITSKGGITTRRERKSVLLNFGCAEPPVIDRISSAPYECLNSK